MLADGASMNLCRYSDEPFNTNEIIWPHWGMAPFHPPTAMMAVAAFAVLGIAAWAYGPGEVWARYGRGRVHRLAAGGEAARRAALRKSSWRSSAATQQVA